MNKTQKRIATIFDDIRKLDYSSKVDALAYVTFLLKGELEYADEQFVSDVYSLAHALHEDKKDTEKGI